MNVDVDAVVDERPVVATALVALVATAAYAGIQLVFDSSVAVAETASFGLIFTLVYVAGNRYLRDGEGEQPDDSRADDPAE
ncbi:hypothetical protein ACFQMA_13240 [Halosimplex aquaticum]|uniref:Uncharacterized protein n=1 Tax=Halosimplex aquaticum TaxID=3026162 RepID=A0ABD5Y0L4_9EURY|nr:hypothetical protein [Halosimplex aquaticum]